ncbi:MAG: PadR family transcriptional regulator [Turicibacter sp.]|nr:PadR family transcriptional regulator [Turicibacter sp.]
MNAQYKKGVLELCVLKLIQQGDLYGYETVQKVSSYIEVTESTIYPLLRRLTKEGYLETYNKESTEGPMRKYYSMTVEGEVYLATLLRDWDEMVESVQRLLKGV